MILLVGHLDLRRSRRGCIDLAGEAARIVWRGGRRRSRRMGQVEVGVMGLHGGGTLDHLRTDCEVVLVGIAVPVSRGRLVVVDRYAYSVCGQILQRQSIVASLTSAAVGHVVPPYSRLAVCAE